MASLVQRLTRLIRGPLFLWRRFQYSTGLRNSRLTTLRSFPKAPYRAVVMGLEEDMWELFDAAYPEYEKRFAPANTDLAELRATLTKRHMTLLVFDRAPKRQVDTVTGSLPVTIFNASYAPLPVLEKDAIPAVGFLIDTMGAWLGARRQTEIDIFLDSFSLENRDGLLDDATKLHSNLQIPSAGQKCLIVANGNRVVTSSSSAEDNSDLHTAATDLANKDNHVMFDKHLIEPWYSVTVVANFLHHLESCEHVVVRESPLGLIACLAGRSVTVTGRPFWAGYGLTSDILSFQRHRSLTPQAIIAIVTLLLSRYVDNTGKIIDPAENWQLPEPQTSLATDNLSDDLTSVLLS